MKRQIESAKQGMKIVALIGFAVLFFGVTARGVGAQVDTSDSCYRYFLDTTMSLQTVNASCTVGGQCLAGSISYTQLVGFFRTIRPPTMTCNDSAPNTSCCLEKGPVLCSRAVSTDGVFGGRSNGTCDATCGSDKIQVTKITPLTGSGRLPELCGTGKVCCASRLPTDPAPEATTGAAGCVSGVLSGFPSTCKAARGTNDTVFGSSNEPLKTSLTACANNGICFFQRGDALCESVTRQHGQGDSNFSFLDQKMILGNATAYVCSKESDCDTKQGKTVEWAALDEPSLCPAGLVCCPGKRSATVAPTTPAPKATPKELPDPLGGVTIHVLIGNIIKGFAGIVGSIALLMFIWGGISMIMAGGDSGKVTKARTILMNATGGIVLIFGAYMFVSAIIDAILAK